MRTDATAKRNRRFGKPGDLVAWRHSSGAVSGYVVGEGGEELRPLEYLEGYLPFAVADLEGRTWRHPWRVNFTHGAWSVLKPIKELFGYHHDPLAGFEV